MNATNKVNLFIIGAAKSGTTSLWHYLGLHPDIFMTDDLLYKEPAFFSLKGAWQGYDYYASLYQSAFSKYAYIGDASTAYLTDPFSAERIYEYNPDSKIIAVLRNPIDRAYSLYNWMAGDGYEYSPSFEYALRIENKRTQKEIPNFLEPEYYWNYLYFSSGLYSDQLKRYTDIFHDNVFVIDFRDFKNNLKSTLHSLFSFLNLHEIHIHPIVKNSSRSIVSSILQFIVRKITIHCHDNKISFSKDNSSSAFKFVFDLFNQYEHELYSQVPHLSPIHQEKESFFQSLESYLSKCSLQFNTITTVKERDVLMSFGFLDTPPPILSPSTRESLYEEYYSSFIELAQTTGIDFRQDR